MLLPMLFYQRVCGVSMVNAPDEQVVPRMLASATTVWLPVWMLAWDVKRFEYKPLNLGFNTEVSALYNALLLLSDTSQSVAITRWKWPTSVTLKDAEATGWRPALQRMEETNDWTLSHKASRDIIIHFWALCVCMNAHTLICAGESPGPCACLLWVHVFPRGYILHIDTWRVTSAL